MFYNASLANTISAIKVGYLARHQTVVIPVSSFTKNVLVAMERAGAISSFIVKNMPSNKKLVEIVLAYKDGRPAISDIRIISTNSNKCYVTCKALRRFTLTTRSCILVSTSRGILSGVECCNAGVGGLALMLICY